MVNFTDTSLDNIVELRNISQTYDGGKTFVIKDFNLLIEDKVGQGQFVVILGMSGCGKSTILRYIAGLQEPTTGEVSLFGKPRTEKDHVGMVFQKYSSMPWLTVLENVALGLQYRGIAKKEREERALEMIKTVGLQGHENKYAQYPTLSGGQLQRVAIARSLLASPKILLMDEPFGALDINTRILMQDLLIDIWKKVHPTIIFITHDIAEAIYLADDIYVMKPSPNAHLVQHIPVTLPIDRNRSIKRDPHFIDLVRYTEDVMVHVYEKVGRE